jgi:membrane-bound lytic murein transglycosylase A
MRGAGHGVVTALLCLLLAACVQAPKPPTAPARPAAEKLRLDRVSFADLPGWKQDDLAGFETALAASCARWEKAAADGEVSSLNGDDPLARSKDARLWARLCVEAQGLRGAALGRFIEANFEPYALSNDGAPEGLFTGYYVPELRASRERTREFPAPLYARPPDLVEVDLGRFRENLRGQRIAGKVENGRLTPFADRAAIDQGALEGKGLEIAWLESEIDSFFLHIQGSARLVFPDGARKIAGYAAQNGHIYRAIGRDLIARGVLTSETVSLQSIRAWLDANPREAAAIMQKNPSYVFFTLTARKDAIGAEGVALTPLRSLAIDDAFLPYGVPVFLDAEDPRNSGARLQRLMMAQDTGGAILGAVRGDVFWGYGDEAESAAGRMKSRGRYWLLVPRARGTPFS